MGVLNGERVLLVEDSEEIRETLKDLLELEGAEIYTAADGRRAIDFLRHGGEVDAIILDLLMGEFDGEWFLAELAGTARQPAIVVFSAASSAQLERIATRFPVLRKPSSGDLVVETLRRAIDGQRKNRR